MAASKIANCECIDINKYAFRRAKLRYKISEKWPHQANQITSHACMQTKCGSGPLSLGCWIPALSPFFYRMCAYCEYVCMYIPGFLILSMQYTLSDKQLSMHE